MQFKNISYLNLDTLYDIVLSKFYDSNYKEVKFSKNYESLLRHISINIELDEVTEYEYIFLKMYSSSITPLFNFRFDSEFITNNYKPISDNLIRLDSLLSDIDNSNENGKQHTLDYYLPSGSKIGNCVITLSGSNLANLITLEPMEFFINASNRKCVIVNQEDNSNNKLDPDYKVYEDDNVKNYIVGFVLNNFYKFMNDKINYIDLPSDSFNHQRFLNKFNIKDNIKLLNMRNPYINIDFIDDGTKTIQDRIIKYKSDWFDNKDDFTIKNTQFEICINSSFGVFTELFKILPIDKFITFDSFRIPAFNSIDNPQITRVDGIVPASYNMRFNSRVSSIYNLIGSSYNNNDLKFYELTENYIPFNYIILISIDDLNTYLYKYILDNKDSNNYRDKLTLDIVNKIVKTIMSIYHML